MSVPTQPVSLPRGTSQRRTAPIPPFSGAETPPPLPGVRCRPAAGRGRRSAAGRGGSGSRCPDARNGREHRRSYRRLRSWWCVSASTACGAGSRPAGPISTAGGRVRRQDLGCWGRRPATATGSCTPPRSRTRCGAAKLKLGCSTVVVFAAAGPASPCTMISCICTDRASVYFVLCVCGVCVRVSVSACAETVSICVSPAHTSATCLLWVHKQNVGSSPEFQNDRLCPMPVGRHQVRAVAGRSRARLCGSVHHTAGWSRRSA